MRKSLASQEDTVPQSNDDEAEEANLRKMGYSQELHRGFTGLMSFSFCFTAVAGTKIFLLPSSISHRLL